MLAAAAALGILSSAAAAQAAMISLAFENTGDADLLFNRTDSGGGVGTFSFTDATLGSGSGSDFVITTPGDAALLFGDLDGTFTIGTITDNGLPPGTTGYTEIAPVTGAGTFAIHDGGGFDLTATLSFSTISTTFVAVNQGISFGNASSGGGIALSAISYGGTNPLLQQLAAIGNASMIVSFGFDPAESLRSLTDNSTRAATTSTPYTGALSAESTADVPAPSSAVVFGMGLLACAVPILRRRMSPA
jgi:hypothetical protein